MPGNASILSDVAGNLAVGTFGSATATVAGKSAGISVGGTNQAGNLTPLAIDAYGSLTIRPGVCPTWTASSVSTVATGTSAGKVMLSVFNGSSTTYQRIAALYAQCPPQVNTQGGLLGIGSGTSYTQIIFGIYRITGHSGGAQLVPVMADPSDDGVLDPGCTVRVNSAVTGLSSAPSFCWDAAYDGSMTVGPRPDLCMKVWTMPPGSGLAVRMPAGLGASVNFLLTITCAQNIA